MYKAIIKYLFCIASFIILHTVMVASAFASYHEGFRSGGFEEGVREGGGFESEQTSGSPISINIDNPLKETSLIGFFNTILDILLIFAVPIIVFFIILAGFQYVMARGEPGAISTANKALLYSVIGGVLILGAKVLLTVISGTIKALGA